MTTRSGVSTSRTEALGPVSRAWTSRIWRYHPVTVVATSADGNGIPAAAAAAGRRVRMRPRCAGSSRSRCQASASGRASSRSVSAVGAQSTTSRSHSALSGSPPAFRPATAARAAPRSPRRRAARSAPRRPPGRCRACPARRGGSPARPATASPSRADALTWSAWRRGSTSTGSPVVPAAARSTPSASPRECAASVDMTRVASPGAGRPDRARRRRRGLADASLPGEEDDPHGAVSPRRASSAPAARCRR